MNERTLILDGSSGGGNTAMLLNLLFDARYEGHAYFCRRHRFEACKNCGACKAEGTCALCDGMKPIYDAAETVKKVVIASPVYFGNLTGFLLDVMSRFQRYFKGGFDCLPRIGPKKAGAVILTAGGHGGTENAERTATMFMKILNVENPELITSYNTDILAASNDQQALDAVTSLKNRWFGA